jgi:transposase
VLALDHGSIHTSRLSRQALAARPWITVEWLPKYAPELNEIERAWRDLKRHFLAHRSFMDADDLEAAIHRSVCVIRFPADAVGWDSRIPEPPIDSGAMSRGDAPWRMSQSI